MHKVVGGHVTHEATINNEVASRVWLAAEVLCTWKWPGGCALASFLPSLSTYAKSGKYASIGEELDSIFNILLDGALVHGGSGAQSLSNIWPALDDKVEHIEEPFLRALVSLIFTLFRDNIWETDKAVTLFELLLNKLSIGEAINVNCLRILPPLVNVLIRTLSYRSIGSGECSRGVVDPDTSEGNLVEDTIRGWLQRTLLFPPLVAWQSGQGKAYYLLKVIFCFVLCLSFDVSM